MGLFSLHLLWLMKKSSGEHLKTEKCLKLSLPISAGHLDAVIVAHHAAAAHFCHTLIGLSALTRSLLLPPNKTQTEPVLY